MLPTLWSSPCLGSCLVPCLAPGSGPGSDRGSGSGSARYAATSSAAGLASDVAIERRLRLKSPMVPRIHRRGTRRCITCAQPYVVRTGTPSAKKGGHGGDCARSSHSQHENSYHAFDSTFSPTTL